MAKPGPKPGDYSFYWYEMGEIIREEGGTRRLSNTELAQRIIARHRLKPTLEGTLRKGFPGFLASGGMKRPKPLKPSTERRIEAHYQRRKQVEKQALAKLEELRPAAEELGINLSASADRIKSDLAAVKRLLERLIWVEADDEALLSVLLNSKELPTQEAAKRELQERMQEHQALKRKEALLRDLREAKRDLAWASMPTTGKDLGKAGKDPD